LSYLTPAFSWRIRACSTNGGEEECM
jgi:hypothetical protein